MMVIDRGQSHQQNRTADERSRTLCIPENMLGTERAAFHRKLLFGVQPLPGEIARFGKRSHVFRCRGKLPSSRSEPPVEELGERAIVDRLELTHVDAVLADKGLDL